MLSIALNLAIHPDNPFPSRPDLPIQQNLPAAFTVFQATITEHENPIARFHFANLLAFGTPLNHSNLRFAIHLFETCIVELNDANSMNNLAMILENGLNVLQPDIARATSLYQQCIDQQPTRLFPYMQLAKLLTEGPVQFRDVPRAVRLYESCIDRFENHDAMRLLADMLAVGTRGVPRDVLRAQDLYRRCVDEVCDMEAVGQLVTLLLSGPVKSDENVESAVAICQTHLGNEGFDTYALADLATYIAEGSAEQEGDTPLAIRLLELSVMATDCSFSKFTLAKLLSAKQRDTVVEERAMLLFESYADSMGKCDEIVSFARFGLALGDEIFERDVRLAIRICEMCIDKWKHPGAMLALAEIVLSGSEGLVREVDRAERLCKRIVEDDEYFYFVIELADSLINGTNFLQRDLKLARRLYESCIEGRADPRAMVQLAKSLASDQADGEKNHTRIFQLCEMSMEDDEFPCDLVCSLGEQLEAPSSHVEDAQLAMRLYELALAKKGCTYAMLNIAELLLRDTGAVERDEERVVRLCERYVDEVAHRSSLHNLARMLSRTTKNEQRNTPVAIRIYELMVRKGRFKHLLSMARLVVKDKPAVEWDAELVVQLCVRYLDELKSNSFQVIYFANHILRGKAPVERSIQLAIRLYEECIERKKEPGAMISLAKYLLRYRRGAEGNLERVVELCERYVVVRGHCYHVVRLAKLVADGGGAFEKDVPLAVRLLEMCVEKLGDTDAKLLLVEIMLSDQNGNSEHAMRLYEQSVRQQMHDYDVLGIARMVSSGTSGFQKNVSLSIQMYEMCISIRNSATAMIRLCQMLISGATDVERDELRALQLYEQHLGESENCKSVLRLAEKVKHGMHGFQKDEAVAVKMYEICISKRKDAHALLSLLQHEAYSGNESRTMRLCDDYIDASSDCDAIFEIARMLSQGPVEMRNVSMAIRLCERCVERKDREAICTLVNILAQCPERDVGRIESLCRRYVEWGDCQAVLQFVKRLFTGWGVDKDLPLARRLCEMCIELRKDPNAKLYLAQILVLSNECDQHILSLCSLHFMRNHVYRSDIEILARMAFTNHKVQVAVDLCDMVFKVCEDVRFLVLLAEIKIIGDGVEIDVEYGLSLCKRAIEAYGEHAVRKFADKVLESENRSVARRILEVCKDDKSRMQLARILVEDGDYEDAFHLCKVSMADNPGFVVSFARWVAFEGQDIGLAIRVCELCVESSSRRGMALLAEILVSGRVPRDVERCIMLCKRAVMEHIHTNYILDVARRAWNGKEMDEDMDLAIRLCEICIERNCENGMLLLAEIVVCGRGAKRDVERCIQLCARCLREGGVRRVCGDILRFSGRVLEGDGVEKDVELAKRIYRMCVKMKMMKEDWELVAEIAGDAGVKEDSAAFWRRAANSVTTSTWSGIWSFSSESVGSWSSRTWSATSPLSACS